MSSGPIPEHIIEAVLKHHDIAQVIGKYVHLSKHGRNLKGLCPFHSEKSPSFNVNPEKQIYKCFGCGVGGHVIRFIQEIEGYSFGEAVRHLAEEANIAYTWEQQTPEQAERQQEKEQIVKGHEFAAKLYSHILKNSAEGKPALDYLRSRGFTDSLIEAFQIGFAPQRRDVLAQFLVQRQFPMSLMEKGALVTARSEGDYVDKFRNRIMFPIRDARGAVIAFAGRTLGTEQPKYLNSPETALFRKSRLLYNYHAARAEIKRTNQVVVFEGYADVIKAWSAGVHNGVATMGTALTEEHALLIRRSTESVVICYDGDDAGQAAAFKSLGLLEKAGLDIKVAVLPNRLDPDEYVESFGADRFRKEIIEGAVPPEKFKLLHLRRNFNLQDNEAKLRYVRTAIREVIADIEAPTGREHYLKELASEFSAITSFESMKQETNETRGERQQKMRSNGDNNDFSWNTVRNGGTGSAPLPKLKPAYDKAERHLLYMMMHDRDISDLVHKRMGDAFNDEAHAALAAYLYAFYAHGSEPDASRYLASIQDDPLERLASSILMTESEQGINDQVIEDYLRQIHKHRQQEEIERLVKERDATEKAGDVLGAAKIELDILALTGKLQKR
ncbi:DNA primase [Paenibacillus hodogayensis]|uniref:DNA primase n=1 Tax=Paenibacillus hodogayensis TaxID=279208 RepID=A0ABV5VQK8_9BACL